MKNNRLLILPDSSDFKSIANKQDASTLEQNLNGLVELMFMSAGSDSWEKMMEYADTKYVAHQQLQYEQILKNSYPDERQMTGDNPYDLSATRYGNNNLQADNAGYGIMQAGIIAETADAERGMASITFSITLVTSPRESDERAAGSPGFPRRINLYFTVYKYYTSGVVSLAVFNKTCFRMDVNFLHNFLISQVYKGNVFLRKKIFRYGVASAFKIRKHRYL